MSFFRSAKQPGVSNGSVVIRSAAQKATGSTILTLTDRERFFRPVQARSQRPLTAEIAQKPRNQPTTNNQLTNHRPNIFPYTLLQLMPVRRLHLLQQPAIAHVDAKNARNLLLQANEQVRRAFGVGKRPVKTPVGRQS